VKEAAITFLTIIATGLFLKIAGDGALGEPVQKLAQAVTEGYGT
jgi:hypothetical protein